MYKKLAAFQADLPKMKKDQQGYNYKYFDINQMLEVMKPLLAKHKLAIFQPLVNLEGKTGVATVIVDLEYTDDPDTWVHSVPLPDLQDAQKMGGCITYFRRYALQSLFSMEAEDDDAYTTKRKAVDPNTKEKPF